MDQFIAPMLIVTIVAILALSLYATRKSGKLDRANPSGLFRPKSFVRGTAMVLLLGYGIAAYLTVKHVFDTSLGFILMGALLLGWVPLVFWFNTRLLLDGKGVTFVSAWGKDTQIDWCDIRTARVSMGGIVLEGAERRLTIRTYFDRYEKIAETVRQNGPENAQ